MKKETVFVLAMMVLSCTGHSNATVLGTIESNRAGNDLGELAEMNFTIRYPLLAGGLGGYDWSVSLSWNVTPDDVGETFLASADTHENFDTLTCLLTNGIDNILFLSDNHSIYVCNALGIPEPTEYESILINGIQNGDDFEGYTIDSIALTVNEFYIDYHELGIGSYTDYSYDITYTINGVEAISNPEPATVMLLGLGGVLLRRKIKG